MDDRRKSQRKQTDQFFGVYHRETDEFIGRLVDMSTKGMMIHSVRPMDLGAIYDFRIDLPKSISGTERLSFEAECVRCEESTSSTENYEMGFKITDINFKEIETIQYLLNDALFNESEDQPKVTLSKKLEKF